MAPIPGTNILAPVVPFDTADTNPTHIDIYGKGGFRSVADHTERDAIFSERQVLDMVVITRNDNLSWRLSTLFTPPGDASKWTAYATGGGGGGDVSGPGSSTDNAIARWDGITGTLLNDSFVFVSDTGGIEFPHSDTPVAITYNICKDDDGALNLHYNVPGGPPGEIGPGHYFSTNGINRLTIDNRSMAFQQSTQSNSGMTTGFLFQDAAVTTVNPISGVKPKVDFHLSSGIAFTASGSISDVQSAFQIIGGQTYTSSISVTNIGVATTFTVTDPPVAGGGTAIGVAYNSLFQNGTVGVGNDLRFITSTTPNANTYNICRDDDGLTNLHYNVGPGAAGTTGPGHYFAFGGINRFTVDNLQILYQTETQTDGLYSPSIHIDPGTKTGIFTGIDLVDFVFDSTLVDFPNLYVSSGLTHHFAIYGSQYTTAGTSTVNIVSSFYVDTAPVIGPGITVNDSVYNSLFQTGTVGVGDDLKFVNSFTPNSNTYNICRDDDGPTYLHFTVPQGTAGAAGQPGYVFAFGNQERFTVDNLSIFYFQDDQTDGGFNNAFYFQGGTVTNYTVGAFNIPVQFNFEQYNSSGGGTINPVVFFISQAIFADADSPLNAPHGATLKIDGNIGIGANFTIDNNYTAWFANGGIRIDGPQVVFRNEIGAGDYTVDPNLDYFIAKIDITGGGDLVHLPDPETIDPGHVFIIKDEIGLAANNNINIDVTGGATIDGQASIPISANFGCLRVISTQVGYSSW